MAVSMFLYFGKGTIDGESEDQNHSKWVEVTGFSHSVEQPTNPARSQSGGTVEKCTHNPIEFTRKMDIASVPIMKACWAGKIWEEVHFHATKDSEKGPVDYLIIEMKNAIIATYNVSGGEGDLPEETVAINYGEVVYQYTPMNKKTLAADTDNKKCFSHNLITNKYGTASVTSAHTHKAPAE